MENEERVKELIKELRNIQKNLTQEQRREIWSQIQEGYCEHCASEFLPCYCSPIYDE